MKDSTRDLPARDPASFHTGVMPAPHTLHVTLTEWGHRRRCPYAVMPTETAVGMAYPGACRSRATPACCS
jgi:hypothetical protein